MLSMDLIYVTRHKVLVEGKSRRQVAAELNIDRKTVAKYLEQSEPKYNLTSPKPAPKLALIKPRMDELIEEWEQRTTKKQHITATRLHRQLRSEGFDIGLTIITKYLREYRRQRKEVFVPLVHKPADSAQVDYFEVTVELNGQNKKCWMFLMRLMHSGYDFIRLYERCDQISFLDGHVRAFQFFKGVPHRCVYDNLKAAVSRVTFPNRELTERFKALASHYLFEPCFARPYTGHDKGGVEGRGNGIRLQHLVPIPRGTSLPQLSQHLLSEIVASATRKTRKDGKMVSEKYEEERPFLLSLPEFSFESRKTTVVSVNSKSKVRVDGATYSVPCKWARLEVTALIGVDELTFIHQGERVTHPKQPPGGERTLYRHYLPELARKPQAVRQVIDELLQEFGGIFKTYWLELMQKHSARDAARVFARVLEMITEHGEQKVRRAVMETLKSGRLEFIPLQINPKDMSENVGIPERLKQYEVESAKAADFDYLLIGEDDE